MFGFESVTDLNNYVDSVFSDNERLCSLSVDGEISGFKRYPSGHCYFSLKDSNSVVSCVMFRGSAVKLDFEPKDGQMVTLYGKAGVYSQNGKYQLYVYFVKLKGKGDLKEQFEQMFKKLSNEGLFDNAHKHKLPILPRRIGVISSGAGAVIHDIILTLKRRNPYFDLLLYPAAVQGEECATQVIEGIDFFANRQNVDVIIIARGGGSYEDLNGFNDEALARRIYNCDIPIISAIGHEVDYTICDYVADLRAATPTAAAELVMPKFDDINAYIQNLYFTLDSNMQHRLDNEKKRVTSLKNHRALYSPLYNVNIQRSKLEMLIKSLFSRGQSLLNEQIVSVENSKKL